MGILFATELNLSSMCLSICISHYSHLNGSVLRRDKAPSYVPISERSHIDQILFTIGMDSEFMYLSMSISVVGESIGVPLAMGLNPSSRWTKHVYR